MSTSKKTVLITGCSAGGIGAALTKIFVEKNYCVFATLRNPSKAGNLADYKNIQVLDLDVASTESIARCAKQVADQTGGTLDILVNNAGVDFLMPLLDANIDEAKKAFDVNFWGLLAVTQAFAPMVVKSKGVIVNHSSCICAWNVSVPWYGLYAASKAAVTQLSETLRVELQPLGVGVMTVMIGAVKTPIFLNSHPGPLQLPAESYYKPARQFIEDQYHGKLHPPSQQPADLIARNLANDILGGAKGVVWRGALASTINWATWVLPAWAMELLLNGGRGLREVSQYYAAKRMSDSGKRC